jgi:hypothetical protein
MMKKTKLFSEAMRSLITPPDGCKPIPQGAGAPTMPSARVGVANTKPIANAARPAKNRPVPNVRHFALKTFINPSLIGRENHAVSRF